MFELLSLLLEVLVCAQKEARVHPACHKGPGLTHHSGSCQCVNVVGESSSVTVKDYCAHKAQGTEHRDNERQLNSHTRFTNEFFANVHRSSKVLFVPNHNGSSNKRSQEEKAHIGTQECTKIWFLFHWVVQRQHAVADSTASESLSQSLAASQCQSMTRIASEPTNITSGVTRRAVTRTWRAHVHHRP